MSDTLASATLITFLASSLNIKPFGDSFCFLFSFTVLLYEYISPIKGPYRFLPAQVLFYSELQIFTSIRPVTAFFLNFVKNICCSKIQRYRTLSYIGIYRKNRKIKKCCIHRPWKIQRTVISIDHLQLFPYN